MKKNIEVNYSNILLIILGIALCAIGTFHEFLSCALSVCLIGVLLIHWKKARHFVFYKNITGITFGVICAMYLLSIIWAVDGGMAFIGFLKFMPVFLFMIALMQDQDTVEQIHKKIPYVLVLLTVISFVAMLIFPAEGFFSVSERFAGTFQYPNSYAMVLLVAELLLILREEWGKKDIGAIFVLLAGILLTGSRTVLVLTILSNVAAFFLIKVKKHRIWLGSLCVSVAILVCIYSAISGEFNLLERLTQISLGESTFVGRILYVYDAIPVILRHPFGTGYMGHYYLQQSIQTGLYSVRFVHNDFVQIALDVGWVPFALIIGAVFKTLTSKNIEIGKKLILVVFCLHCCFDFNLQFIAVFCLFITFFDLYGGNKQIIQIEKKCFRRGKTGVLVMAGICVYMGAALFFSAVNEVEMAHKLYPWNTQNEINRIMAGEDLEAQKKVADGILKRNENVVLAYSVNARYAYQQGNFTDTINCKRTIFNIAPFEYAEYEEYCYMLINGISIYEQLGDVQSAQVCWNELETTINLLSQNRDRISRLGSKIDDQPTTRLPLDIQRFISERGGNYS